MNINAKRAVALVTELMGIPGVSRDEKNIIEHLRKLLKQIGVPASAVKVDNVNRKTPGGGNSGNLIVKLSGTIKAPRRLLLAHVDTVPVCLGSKPVRKGKYIISADKNTGLGADDRAGVAVIFTALREIIENRLPHPPLTFLFCVQEEIGMRGVRYMSLSDLGKPAMGFNYDGGHRIVIGATGAYHLDIEIKGIPSHAGAAPQNGASAIVAASVAIAELQRGGWLGAVKKGGKTGTSNIGVIEAGNATNVVCPQATLRAEVRSHDPVFRKKIMAEIEKAFVKAAKVTKNVAGKSCVAKMTRIPEYESFRLPEKTEAVQAAVRAYRALKLKPELEIMNAGLDANWLVELGVPTVTLGNGAGNAHTTLERLDVAEFEICCRAALQIATGI
jgi:tripeptide aminopeptidase